MTSNDSGSEVDGQEYDDFSASPENNVQNGLSSGVIERTSHEDNATVIENIYDIENSKNESEAKESRGLLAFCIVFGFGSLFSSSVQAYMSSQITVLERTFGMSSSTSGILLTANDIGFVATVLIASHFLHRYHIPRILGACILVFGVSGMLTSLPHFMMNEKMPSHSASLSNSSDSDNNNLLCTKRSNNWTVQSGCDALDQGSLESKGDNKWVLAFIAIMLVIQGIAKSSRQPLSTIYVDNNAKKEKTGFYIGILSTFSIFGPMIAITAGGLFSKLPVDLKETSLQPEDPRWVGAWWLGFIVFGACAMLVSLPVFCFPAGRRLPQQKTNNSKLSEHSEEQPEETCCHYFKDLPQSIFRVVSRPVYTLNLVAIIFQMFSVLSLGAFGPKYIENQFNIPTWQANVILGPEKLVTTVLGTFGGGLLTRRLKLDTTGCVKLIVAARTISLFLNCFNFLFGCDNPPIVGLDSSNRAIANTTCGCDDVSYLPMCADGQTFFSPCHAGCQVQTEKGFTQCLGSTSGDVTSGLCGTSCYSLIPFIVTNAVSSLIGTLVIAPTYVVVLRSVKDKDRSMAVGLLSFLISLLVFLPAPIVYGKLFDSLCLAWKHSCTGKGACSLYDVTGMRVKFNATDIGLRLGSVLFTLLTFCCSRRELNSNTKYEQEKEIDPPTDYELRNKKQTKTKINRHSKAQPEFQSKIVADNSDIGTNKKPLPVIPRICDNKTNNNKEQEDNGYYVNVDINPDDLSEIKRHKPLPAISDKRPVPSPRLS